MQRIICGAGAFADPLQDQLTFSAVVFHLRYLECNFTVEFIGMVTSQIRSIEPGRKMDYRERQHFLNKFTV